MRRTTGGTPPVIGRGHAVRCVCIVETILGVAVNITAGEGEICPSAVVDAMAVLRKNGILQEWAGVLSVQSSILTPHYEEVVECRLGTV